MKKLALFVCLLVVTVAAQAQFEKGKWILNPSITGLEFSHDTGTDKTSFGLEAKGGAFLLDNIALLVHISGCLVRAGLQRISLWQEIPQEEGLRWHCAII